MATTACRRHDPNFRWNRLGLHATAAVALSLAMVPPAVASCSFSNPIGQGGLLGTPPGYLLLPDPDARLGGYLWELGHGDPADGPGNDGNGAVFGAPAGADRAFVRRDFGPAGTASIVWDWANGGMDGCLSGGPGQGVTVAHVLDDSPGTCLGGTAAWEPCTEAADCPGGACLGAPNYALLAVTGTAEPVPAHNFDEIDGGAGASGRDVPLRPLALLPAIRATGSAGGGQVIADVAPASASVNCRDNASGAICAGPGLMSLGLARQLIERNPGGGGEVPVSGCDEGCSGVTLRTDREYCWDTNADGLCTAADGAQPAGRIAGTCQVIPLPCTSDAGCFSFGPCNLGTVVTAFGPFVPGLPLRPSLPPVADAGSDDVVAAGALVTLDGTGSFDPEAERLGYSWSQTEGPAVVLSAPTSATPSFVAPAVELEEALTFALTVTDPWGGTDTDTVLVTVTEEAAGSPPLGAPLQFSPLPGPLAAPVSSGSVSSSSGSGGASPMEAVVTLEWLVPGEAPEPGEPATDLRYRVYRKAAGGSYGSLQEGGQPDYLERPAGSLASFADVLPGSGVYFYQVREVDAQNQEGDASRTLRVDFGPAPGNVSGVSLEEIPGAVRLSWSRLGEDPCAVDGCGPAEPEEDLLGYHVYRGGQRLTPRPIREASFVDPDPPWGGSPLYSVFGVSPEGESASGGSISIGLTVKAFLPSAPGGVRGFSGPGAGEVTVLWAPSPEEEDVVEYEVSCETEGGCPESVVSGGTTAVIGGLPAGREYAFRVRAVDAEGQESPWSAPVQLRPALPASEEFGPPELTLRRRTATAMRPGGRGEMVHVYRREEGAAEVYERRNAAPVGSLDHPLYEPGWEDRGHLRGLACGRRRKWGTRASPDEGPREGRSWPRPRRRARRGPGGGPAGAGRDLDATAPAGSWRGFAASAARSRSPARTSSSSAATRRASRCGSTAT
jgi:hypothetical protein